VQLDFLDALLKSNSEIESISDTGVLIGQSKIPLECVRNTRAKRYIVRLLPELVLRVTIPRGGSRKEALRFVSENFAWVEKQFLSLRLQDSLVQNNARQTTKTVLFRGRRVPINSISKDNSMMANSSILQTVSTNETAESQHVAIEKCLLTLAKDELPKLTFRLAGLHGFAPRRVTIRNQKTRWGSCSSTGGISLNWRLVQVPAFVRDYVILHELVHLDHLNHSTHFWKRLAKACPNHNAAEAWLKMHGPRMC
jgi:hypothetical protein